METTKAHSKILRQFFFWSGIIATLAYRIIIILNNFNPIWVRIAWYIGTVGFIIYFIHRYDISDKRSKLIEEHQLLAKIKNNKPLNEGDTDALQYILRTLKTTKEKWNYIFIFVASGIALIIGIILDFVV